MGEVKALILMSEHLWSMWDLELHDVVLVSFLDVRALVFCFRGPQLGSMRVGGWCAWWMF